MNAGRFAPSPTGELHLGNLRTAILAWAWARKSGRRFYLRLEDLDQDRARDPQTQIDDLKELGIDWDGPIVIQSERISIYEDALDTLRAKGHVFECFCSRKDIREAASAAHTPPTSYPGPCANLSREERDIKLAMFMRQNRRPALRLKPDATEWSVEDELHGTYTGPVESVVLQRGDGAIAYNLAVVVDDLAMGIDQVVRGDDLLESAPTQSYLSKLLGGTQPTYAHVPLVLGPSGQRLAKRDGAVTISQLKEAGCSTSDIVETLTKSTGCSGANTLKEFLSRFNPTLVATIPCTYPNDMEPLPMLSK